MVPIPSKVQHNGVEFEIKNTLPDKVYDFIIRALRTHFHNSKMGIKVSKPKFNTIGFGKHKLDSIDVFDSEKGRGKIGVYYLKYGEKGRKTEKNGEK